MIFNLIVLPQAEDDLQVARDWYKAEQEGFGERFIRAVGQAILFITEYPLALPLVFDDYRMMATKRFPFCLYFVVTGEVIHRYAILHGKQDREGIFAKRRWRTERKEAGPSRQPNRSLHTSPQTDHLPWVSACSTFPIFTSVNASTNRTAPPMKTSPKLVDTINKY